MSVRVSANERGTDEDFTAKTIPEAIAEKERTRLRRIFVRLQEAITGA
jgi:hypothetical protein